MRCLVNSQTYMFRRTLFGPSLFATYNGECIYTLLEPFFDYRGVIWRLRVSEGVYTKEGIDFDYHLRIKKCTKKYLPPYVH